MNNLTTGKMISTIAMNKEKKKLYCVGRFGVLHMEDCKGHWDSHAWSTCYSHVIAQRVLCLVEMITCILFKHIFYYNQRLE